MTFARLVLIQVTKKKKKNRYQTYIFAKKNKIQCLITPA
jgi:hypothetical protein